MPSTTIQIRAEDKTKAAFRQINSRTEKLNRSFQGLSTSLGGLKTAFVGMIGVGALGKFTKDILTLGDRLQKVSLQTGLAVEELEILQFAASQSGVATDAFNTALQKFSRNIGEAEQGTAAQKEAFESLGISITDSTGGLKDTSALFAEVAEALSGVEAPATKAATATDLFGRAGIELLPLLNTGAAGISGYAETIRNANGIIGTDAANAFSKFNDKLDVLQRSFRGKLAPVLTAILPALTMLAENLDTIAKFAGIAATAFLVAKIPAAFIAITVAVKGLTLAMAANPLGLIATGLAAIAVYKGDEIMDAFGFAKEAPKELEKTNTKLEDTAKILKDVSKAEKIRTKTAESFAKTTKKDVVPNLKKLEKSLKDSNIQFKNIRGQEGLGGLQLAFLEFFGDVQTHALNYLSDASAIVSKHLATIKQDFTEMITGLQNQLVFRRNDISDAFADILAEFERELEETKIDVENINIEIPSSAFDFTNTFAKVPGEIFDFTAVNQAAGAIDSLVKQINSYSVTSRTVSKRARSAGGTNELGRPMTGHPFWENEVPAGYHKYGTRMLDYDVPSISSSGSSSRSSGRSSMSSGSSALESTGGKTPIQVNIYDGTGQKISAYDSSIRVEINERASRYNEFSAMAA